MGNFNMETCLTCRSSQRKGTPCRCPHTDDGPTNDRTPEILNFILSLMRIQQDKKVCGK